MQLIILSPNFDLVFTEEQKAFLQGVSAVVYKEQKPFTRIQELRSDEPKVLMIDPDFCNWNLTQENVDSINNLQVILLQTTSFSWLPVDYVTSKNIPVCNIKGFSGPAVADYLLMMTLALSRKLPLIIKNSYKQDFSDKFLGFELKGKRAGIIGLGTIGKLIAERCSGLGMEIVYWSPHSTSEQFTPVSIEELLVSADVVYPCFAINEFSKNILSNEALSKMKPSSLFVSPIHGVFDAKYLQERVFRGKLGGLAYEDGSAGVHQIEGNSFILPDHAWMTHESMRRNGEGWIANLKAALAGDPINKVN